MTAATCERNVAAGSIVVVRDEEWLVTPNDATVRQLPATVTRIKLHTCQAAQVATRCRNPAPSR